MVMICTDPRSTRLIDFSFEDYMIKKQITRDPLL
jgi:hypothetical protein